jgi:YkoY family integral membrane protein
MGFHFAEQKFQVADLRAVLLLIVLEGLLSADNALVLAIMVRHLPQDQQKKALLYGLGGAFVFRFIAILLATQIIQFWPLQVLGALYLAFISVKHFVLLRKGQDEGEEGAKKLVGKGFWATVIAVEFTDIAFAVDSVLAAVAVVNVSKEPEKLWVVYSGAIIGVVLLRFAAGAFIKLLDRFPHFEHLAYALILWVAVKLGMMSLHNLTEVDAGKQVLAFCVNTLHWHPEELNPALFWAVTGVIIAVGTVWSVLHQRKANDLAEQAKNQPE